MLVLKLAYTGEFDFIKELQELKALLKKKNIVIGLVESIEGTTHIIKIMCEAENYNEKVNQKVNVYVSNILYNIVINYYKKKELFEFITDSYFFLKQDEIIEVEKDIMDVLKGEGGIKDENSVYCMNKINEIQDKIRECIEENREININGFITFRMRELREDIEAIIEKVVEKYMVEKEYKEFIKLLKYFVDIQESKIEEINLVIKGKGNYKVFDGYGEDILEEFLKELVDSKLGMEANVEDVIISGLITNAPRNIIIHNEPLCTNKEFLDTIRNVFGDRVKECSGCAFCTAIEVK
ncbi:MAG: putative sporulation protein YtxC [Clostridium sp.]